MDDAASASLRSTVSSPGMPNTCRTPSASRHSTNNLAALCAAKALLLGLVPVYAQHGRRGRVESQPATPSSAPFPPPLRRYTLSVPAPSRPRNDPHARRPRSPVLVPASASASTVYTIRGAGFGHGGGLSQFGAEGMARKGADHRRILSHYSRGTVLGRAPTDR